MKTFDLEETLPRLPVPELPDTIEKYLRTLKPLTNEHEYARQVKHAQDFLVSVGPKLQQRLLERDKKEKYSWLEEWWSNYAYMEYRDSILINVTYGFTFEDSPLICQIQRASVLVNGMLLLKRQLENELFPQDKTKANEPLCMVAYRAMFHSCRIPVEKRDITEYYQFNETNYIVVLKSGNFYAFDTCDDGAILCPAQIKEQLINILKMDKYFNGKTYPVQILACQNRDKWANSRSLLILDPTNKKSLQLIQKSAFVLALDDASPRTLTEASRILLCGDSSITNRFYDSPFNLIIFKNGKAGLIGEHSRMDGQPACVVCDLLLKFELEQIKNPNLWTIPHAKSLTKPTMLQWNVTEQLSRELDQVILDVKQEISNLDSIVLECKKGKFTWKSVGCSPDAAVQLGLQLAYFTIHKKFPAVYESVSTRHFRRGRTETGRSLSIESKAFVEGFFNTNLSDSERIELFRKAEKSHVQYAKTAAKGFSCDRHLLGLRLLTKEFNEDLHPLFSDPIFSKSCHWQLSTSTLAPEMVTSISFGPVVSDGYGICYVFREHDVNVSITNFITDHFTDSKRFAYLLDKYLSQIESLLIFQKRSSKL
jgi:carnitine O-acetyltransferase